MWSSGRAFVAPTRGSLHLNNRSNACSGVHRPTLRTTQSRNYRRKPVEVLAFGGDPYEPLEKAINIINKVLTVGASKPKNSNGKSNGGGGRERWVQFGTEASSRLSLQDLTAKDAELDREGTSRLLQEYLSLPVEDYSLLDPKWVVREQPRDDDGNKNFNLNSDKRIRNNSFRVSVPLKDMLGVDICPQVSIEARPDPLNGQVTLIGTRAVLGSPGLDDMFKLKLVAVMRCRRKDRHLPGRPVQRLRQWAAQRRGGNSKNLLTSLDAAGVMSSESGGGGTAIAVAEVVDISEFTDLDQVTFSEDEEDDEEDIIVDSENDNFSSGGTSSSPSFRFSTDISADTESSSFYSSSSSSDTEGSSTNNSSNEATVGTALSATSQSAAASTVAAQAPLLDCKVQINMAVKVPGALRVVPNGLLGYAGSVIGKTVLNAVLPNFLQLLSADFKQWVAVGGRRRYINNENAEGVNKNDSEANGSLFTPLIGTTASSSERTGAP